MVTNTEEMTIDGSAARAWSDGPKVVIGGNYEVDLEHPLGTGGMAIVYRGRDIRNRRDVALKTLRPEYLESPETRARFRREARIMTLFNHPNIIRIYDHFEDNGAPWVALEFAPGCSIKEEVARRGPFPLEETAQLLDQVALALDHLHDRGMVHLDIKPQNLILTPQSKIKVIDFGLAQRAGGPQEMIAGATFGTAAYLSPEQASGAAIDSSTDMYALGCVVYEMLTGRPPFGADASTADKDEVIRAHLDSEPALPSSLRSLPKWVDDAVAPALAKNPRDRYRDCSAFARRFWSGLDAPNGIVAIHAPTAKFSPPPIFDSVAMDEDDCAEGISSSRSLSAKLAGGAYRTGGRIARRTGWLQRFLWRATLALFVGNLLLAGLLYIDRGEIPGVIAADVQLHPGGIARVTTNDLRLRASPGRDSGILTVLDTGQQLTITGDAVTAGGETWWPVRASIDGRTYNGFVAGGWIEPSESPKEVWLKRATNEIETWPGRFVDWVIK